MFGFSLIRLGIYAAVALGLLGSLWGGYAYLKHKAWIEGRDAALAAVAQQNGIAANAAKKVELTTDMCFDAGGTWSVVEGKCIQ